MSETLATIMTLGTFINRKTVRWGIHVLTALVFVLPIQYWVVLGDNEGEPPRGEGWVFWFDMEYFPVFLLAFTMQWVTLQVLRRRHQPTQVLAIACWISTVPVSWCFFDSFSFLEPDANMPSYGALAALGIFPLYSLLWLMETRWLVPENRPKPQSPEFEL